jgi:uncharacterized membrane protein YfcA
MENDLFLSLFGFAVGLFGTLIGAGGGFILTPVLLLLYPRDTPDAITSISLAVTFANSLSGSFAYARMKRIHYRYGLAFAAAAAPGAVLGALSTYYVARKTFDLIFGIILMIASVVIYLKPVHDANEVDNKTVALSGARLLSGIGISVIVGFISSFLGIGGGIIHVPVLVWILHFPVHIGTATSHFILAITTFVGMLVHIITGTFHHGMARTAFLAVGVLAGAQGGAFLSAKVKGTLIIRSLAVALGLAAVRLLFGS